MANTNIRPRAAVAERPPFVAPPSGNTRLGLHVTSDELAIWQTRSADNTNGINGVTYQTMYNVIKTKADAFVAAPTTATWNPTTGEFGSWTASTVFPDDVGTTSNTYSPGGSGCCDAGGIEKVTASAFAYMITGTSSYGTPVRTWLLNHAGNSLLDFSNTTAWRRDLAYASSNYDGILIRVGKWLHGALFAYDYLRIGGGILSTGDRTTIETWLNEAGLWLAAKLDNSVKKNAFPSRTYASCTGGQCGSAQNGSLYNGGPATTWLTETWSNRMSSALIFVSAAAVPISPVITWDTSFTTAVKTWVKELLMFATWSTGTTHDTYRWSDGGGADPQIGSSWIHGAFPWGAALMAADHLARAGDDELYTYSTTSGLDGMTGVNAVISGQTGTAKTLLMVAQRYADMASGTVKVYASSTHTDTWWIRASVESGHGEDLIGAMSNLYWNDTKVKGNYTGRTAIDHSGINTWGGPWGVLPHVLFMFGDLEGVVNPYL